jgi:hypothetical protein
MAPRIPPMYPSGSIYPNQSPIPSQAPSYEPPYSPAIQSDIAQHRQMQGEMNWGQGNLQAFVMTTFDARPIQAYDWVTYSGTNAGGASNPDVWNVTDTIHSLFYRVPQGKVAIVRDWDILTFPFNEDGPPVTIGGLSDAFGQLSFFVDGIAQDQYNRRLLSTLPFGPISGVAYIIAGEQSLIEMRLTGSDASNAVNPAQTWLQSLMAMHGNLLISHGLLPTWEPATQGAVPITG